MTCPDDRARVHAAVEDLTETEPDILTRIDTHIGQATTAAAEVAAEVAAQVAAELGPRMCACGCPTALTDNSVSEYFATASCQRRWHGAQAHNPQDVYDRGDAARVHVGNDSYPVPLEDPHPTPGARQPAPDHRPDHQPAAARIDVPVPFGAEYRRYCQRCADMVTPVAREETWDIMSFGNDEPVRDVERRTLECPGCLSWLPDPPFTGTATCHNQLLVLELSDGQSRVRRSLNTVMLGRVREPGDLIRLTWREMERMLGRFRASFSRRGR